MKSLVLQEISKQYIATNNGLEQVYQNRLIEGQDFEKADWLRSDGLAYIPIGYNNFGKDVIKFRLRNLNPIDYIAEFGVETHPVHIDYARFLIRFQNNSYTYYPADTTSTTINADNFEYNVVWENGYVTINNTRRAMKARKTIPQLNLFGFTVWNGVKFGISTSRNTNTEYNFFEIENVISLTPCKLLRNCPPNLSANGKPYAQGECGMIDSVSGKFYGNSGSGSFSVCNDPTE